MNSLDIHQFNWGIFKIFFFCTIHIKTDGKKKFSANRQAYINKSLTLKITFGAGTKPKYSGYISLSIQSQAPRPKPPKFNAPNSLLIKN